MKSPKLGTPDKTRHEWFQKLSCLNRYLGRLCFTLFICHNSLIRFLTLRPLFLHPFPARPQYRCSPLETSPRMLCRITRPSIVLTSLLPVFQHLCFRDTRLGVHYISPIVPVLPTHPSGHTQPTSIPPSSVHLPIPQVRLSSLVSLTSSIWYLHWIYRFNECLKSRPLWQPPR